MDLLITDRIRTRLWTRVVQGENGCWNWAGTARESGYGSFAYKKPDGGWTYTSAHRISFTDLVGPILNENEVDHLCRNRACVRPEHLEQVTLAENRRRRDVRYKGEYPTDFAPIPEPPKPKPKSPKRNPETHCKNWHEYAVTGFVTNGTNSDGSPRYTCKACRDEASERRKQKNYQAGGKISAAERTHCPEGHEYTPENTYVKPSTGHRECRTCIRKRSKRQWDQARLPDSRGDWKSRTHCPRGHEYDEENTYFRPKTGHRVCRRCARERQRK